MHIDVQRRKDDTETIWRTLGPHLICIDIFSKWLSYIDIQRNKHRVAILPTMVHIERGM